MIKAHMMINKKLCILIIGFFRWSHANLPVNIDIIWPILSIRNLTNLKKNIFVVNSNLENLRQKFYYII